MGCRTAKPFSEICRKGGLGLASTQWRQHGPNNSSVWKEGGTVRVEVGAPDDARVLASHQRKRPGTQSTMPVWGRVKHGQFVFA